MKRAAQIKHMKNKLGHRGDLRMWYTMEPKKIKKKPSVVDTLKKLF